MIKHILTHLINKFTKVFRSRDVKNGFSPQSTTLWRDNTSAIFTSENWIVRIWVGLFVDFRKFKLFISETPTYKNKDIEVPGRYFIDTEYLN